MNVLRQCAFSQVQTESRHFYIEYHMRTHTDGVALSIDLHKNRELMDFHSETPIATTNFKGRDSELQQMDDYLNIHHSGQRVVVLWGLPGFGKTQLALRYRDQNEKKYKCTMWADASSPGSM